MSAGMPASSDSGVRSRPWWRVSQLKAWASATKRAVVEDILTGARKYARHPDVTRDGGKFIKNPATWLNGDCWEDETTIAAAAQVVPFSPWDRKVGGAR